MTDLHLFDAYGIELEYMIVDADSLDVRPIADAVLAREGGGHDREVARGPLAWSNELALHVIELKTNGPVATLQGAAQNFQVGIGEIEKILAGRSARLLPTAMHPWMDPQRDLVLWPHEHDVIYQTFNRIFDCRGHGWANLQSMHINLPFTGDEEFARLHAAIRLVLPLLPALAASSPIADGVLQPSLDARLEAYRHNARRIPSVSGRVVPEAVFSRADYEREIFARIYKDLEPHDPDGVLREEWVNARGAIARFDRMAIEIRVLDVQECPVADLAIAMAVTRVVRAMTEERWCSDVVQRGFHEVGLALTLDATIRDADRAQITDLTLLAAFGYPEPGPALARDLWQHLVESVVAPDPEASAALAALSVILERGCLARRIHTALDGQQRPERAVLHALYTQLADCLRRGHMFSP